MTTTLLPAYAAEESDSDELFDDEDDSPPPSHRRRTWTLIFCALLVAVAATYGAWWWRKSHGTAAASQTQYKIASAALGRVRRTVSASGTLQAWTTVDIKSKAGGRVNSLTVEVGDTVRKGQVIARIDPADTLLSVQQSQADVDSARAKIAQSDTQYQIQVKQSVVNIETARAQLENSVAGLDAARARLATARTQARAQPRLTQADVEAMQASYNAAVEQRSQLDATQPQDRAQAQTSYDQAKADNDNAQANLTRQKSLLAQGFVSQQAVDQAQATATSAQASVRSTQQKLATIEAQQKAERQTSDAKVAQARAQLTSAQAQTTVMDRRNALGEAEASLKQAQSQVAQSQAALDQAVTNQANNSVKQQDIASSKATAARAQASLTNAQSTLSQTVVRAPEDGVVLTKYVEQGTIITSGLSLNASGTSIVQLGDISRMYVDVSVDETDIAGVDDGQAVDVSIDAYPGVPFEGKVARINPQAQVESNVTTVHVRVEISSDTPTFRLLKPGMNATCEFIQGAKEGVLTVPKDAVHEGDNGDYVDVASGGKPAPADAQSGTAADPNTRTGVTLRRTPVQVGLRGNDTVEIVSGLKAGDTVVTQTIEPETPTAATQGGAMGSGGPPMGGGGRR